MRDWRRFGLVFCLVAGCVDGTGGLRPGEGEDDAGAVTPSPDGGVDAGPERDAGPEPDAGACTPTTCAELGFACGPAADGCGGRLDCGPCGTWTALEGEDGPEGRFDASLAWTGRGLMVWGGYTRTGPPRPGGAIFEDGVWRPLPEQGAPRLMREPCMVRAPLEGEQVFVWGGALGGGTTATTEGAIFDAARDVWRPINEAGAPTPRAEPVCVVAGDRIAVFGGQGRFAATGALYDPASDTWTRLPNPDPSPEQITRMVYTGELLVVGPRPWLAYELEAERWRLLPEGGPSVRDLPGVAWTGREVLVFGGHDESQRPLGDAYAWTPGSDRWRAVPMADGPGPRVPQAVHFTGSEVLTWGCRSGCRTGYQYRPDEDRWVPMASNPRVGALAGVLSVWTGEALVLWGGHARGLEPANVGWWYRP